MPLHKRKCELYLDKGLHLSGCWAAAVRREYETESGTLWNRAWLQSVFWTGKALTGLELKFAYRQVHLAAVGHKSKQDYSLKKKKKRSPTQLQNWPLNFPKMKVLLFFCQYSQRLESSTESWVSLGSSKVTLEQTLALCIATAGFLFMVSLLITTS